MNKKKISFQMLLLCLGIIPVLISMLISSIMSVSQMESELEEAAYEKLAIAANGLAEYYIYDIENVGEPDLDDYVDTLKNQGVELTLFKDDTRISTSIFKDGSTTERNIGTQADSTIYADVKSGKTVEKDHVKISGDEYYVAYVPIMANGSFWGMAFAGIKEATVNKAVATARNSIIILAVVLLIISIVAIVLIASSLKKPMEAAVKDLQMLAEGNINGKNDNTSVVKELQDIIEASKHLQNALNTAIGSVKNSAEVLAFAVREVDEKTESNTSSVSQINESINEVSQTSQEVATSAQTLADKAAAMGYDIDELTENVRVLTDASKSIKVANAEATDYINTVMKSSNESVTAVNDISMQINSTNEAIEKIKAAVGAINEIASQTSLLALNASIEAARAGDAGRGFAVVADEIGKLSTQSKDSSDEIALIADDIVEASAKSVASAKAVTDIINAEQNYIRETQQRFVVLSQSVDSSISEIESIAAKTESLNVIKAEVASATSDLGAMAEELGASAEEVSASCNIVLSACSDTRAKTEEMTATDEELGDAVAFFQV